MFKFRPERNLPVYPPDPDPNRSVNYVNSGPGFLFNQLFDHIHDGPEECQTLSSKGKNVKGKYENGYRVRYLERKKEKKKGKPFVRDKLILALHTEEDWQLWATGGLAFELQ